MDSTGFSIAVIVIGIYSVFNFLLLWFHPVYYWICVVEFHELCSQLIFKHTYISHFWCIGSVMLFVSCILRVVQIVILYTFRYLVCEDHTSNEVLCDDGLAYDDISQKCVYRSSTCGGYMRLLLPDHDISYRELLGER